MREIGIGVVGGGYMGKAHSVAMAAVGAVFNTALRPRLEMICATSDASTERYRAAYGFARGTADWRVLVADPKVQAVVIASPQETHGRLPRWRFRLESQCFARSRWGLAGGCDGDGGGGRGVRRGEHGGVQTTSARRQPVRAEAGGGWGHRRCDLVPGRAYRGFRCGRGAGGSWRNFGRANGTMGDLAPHMVNAALALIGRWRGCRRIS